MLWLFIISFLGLVLILVAWLFLLRQERGIEEISPHELNDYRISNKILFTASIIIIPICALNLYYYLGEPQYASHTQTPNNEISLNDSEKAPDINAMVNRLRLRLETNPNDPEGWRMLARSYTVMERWDDAALAYEQLRMIDEDSVFARLGLVDALMMANKPTDGVRIDALIEDVLNETPTNPMALWLKAERHFEKKQYKEAIKIWRTIKSELPAGSAQLESINERIASAQAALAKLE